MNVQSERAEALFHDAGVFPLPRVCSIVHAENLAHGVDAAALPATRRGTDVGINQGSA